MTSAWAEPDGRIVVDAERYRLDVGADGMLASLTSPGGEHWASLRLLSALDRIDGPDETLEIEAPRLLPGARPVVEVARRSTAWDHAVLTVACRTDTIELTASVRGHGQLSEVHLLGGRSLVPRAAQGFLPSGSSFASLFSANPGDPARLVQSTRESTVIGVAGDSEPGRGHWFFTPAPLYLALTTASGIADPEEVVDGWLALAIEAPLDELTFSQLAYEAQDGAFSLRLDYEGHTDVVGQFRTPALTLTVGVTDPYAGLGRHRVALVERGAARPRRPRDTPGWWSAPIFCGWGAQCHLASLGDRRAADLSTQANYDDFLDRLDDNGVVPGTVVIDDKWQDSYGTCLPDGEKWPDLRGWIDSRRSRGQRVLLWWKAWDPEGLPPELCIRNPDGAPIALDPTNPAARTALRDAVEAMVGPAGADADGLKIDFTAQAPSGRSLSIHGAGWGIALLHELLSVVYAAVKRRKPDALVITHTPHPSFVDVSDMIRLNDMLRLADRGPLPSVVPQMRYRAAVVRAACPELLIDTDDWCVPDKAAWREFLEIKPDLGVPSLYYATHLDLTGEALDADDYAALRRSWERWESSRSAMAATPA